MNTERLFALIDEHRDELFALLSSMVKINSEGFTTHGNEEAMARYVDTLCRELGLESDLYSPLDLPGFKDHPDYFGDRHLENRYNVTARGRGAEDIDELLLMGHSDTVKIGDLANWDGDPLSGAIKDGKIYGRGACDDKYALATALFLIKLLKAEGFTPKRNLIFSAYSDEEYGGSHGALASVLRTPCNRILNMDGRVDTIWNCASGGGEIYYRCHTEKTADSAKIPALAIPVIIEVLEEFAENRRRELEVNPYYAGTDIPASSLRYMAARAGNYGADLGTAEVLFVFYTDKTKEEIYRELDGLAAKIAERLAPFGIVGDGFSPRTRFFHYVECDQSAEDIRLLQEAGKETGRTISLAGPCLSDLSVIAKYGGAQAIAYGVGSDFSQPGGPHQPNECIDCEDFVAFTKTIGSYILKVLG